MFWLVTPRDPSVTVRRWTVAVGAHGEVIHITLTRKKRGQEAGRVMCS